MSSYTLLKSLKEPLTTLEFARQPELVREIQELLKTGGFYTGAIDSKYGSNTDAAFKDFKERAYLEFPNILGVTTAEALLELSDKAEAKHPTPTEAVKPVEKDFLGKRFKLPGGEICLTNEVIRGCRYFKWGEATKNGSRIPANKEIVRGIINLAAYLETVRAYFQNRTILVTSWYRDPLSNSAVGGVRNSIHLQGMACDFVVSGIPPLDVYQLLNHWHGNKGGLGRSSQFTHLDLRQYTARWNY